MAKNVRSFTFGSILDLILHVLSAAVFLAAVSGSSVATLTTVGKMTIPELRKRNYPEHLIVSTMAGPATLGLMIPPSIIMIVYGALTNESIAALNMAGIFPGLVLAAMFSVYAACKVLTSKDYNLLIEPDVSWKEKLNGTRTSVMISFILIAASSLSLAMGYLRLPEMLAQWVEGFHLSAFWLLKGLLVLYTILGHFLDGISCVALTISIVEPKVRHAGIDMIWFGIFMVLVVEMAQITPPVGFNLTVLQSMTGHDMFKVGWWSVPMHLVMLTMFFVLIAFPQLATWLPHHMIPVRAARS